MAQSEGGGRKGAKRDKKHARRATPHVLRSQIHFFSLFGAGKPFFRSFNKKIEPQVSQERLFVGPLPGLRRIVASPAVGELHCGENAFLFGFGLRAVPCFFLRPPGPFQNQSACKKDSPFSAALGSEALSRWPMRIPRPETNTVAFRLGANACLRHQTRNRFLIANPRIRNSLARRRVPVPPPGGDGTRGNPQPLCSWTYMPRVIYRSWGEQRRKKQI